MISLTKNCGFKIQKVLGMNTNIENYFESEKIISCFKKLSENEKLIALDLLLKPERHFLILNKV